MRRHRTLAIDVVLLPPQEVVDRATAVNQRLWQASRQGFPFDRTHLPHITLVQQYISVADIPVVWSAIRSVGVGFLPLPVRVTAIDAVHFSDGNNVSYYSITMTSELKRLHEELMNRLEPYVTDGDVDSYVTDSGETVRPLSFRWTEEFRDRHAHTRYEPHITLGVGPVQTFDKPFTFTADRLALCRLGNFNTCREVLREWQLGAHE